MVLINGVSEYYLNVSDRGLQYGDGLFETLVVRKGQPDYLQEHLHRLQHGCNRLLIPCPPLELLATEVLSIAQSSDQAVLKIIVTRGAGGRGYRQPCPVSATRILSIHPYPSYPEAYKLEGVVVRFCHIRLGMNPALAGIKHLNRLEQVLARAEWDDPMIQEGLMLDVSDHVIEGTMSNLFFIKDQTLVTSPLTHSGVAGIMRGQIMKLARTHNIPIQEQFFQQQALLEADEIFVSNSIIGIWPVKQVQDKVFPVGEMTQRIMTWFQ